MRFIFLTHASRTLVFAASAAISIPAQAGNDITMKNGAIIGTLASWGIAALRQSPIKVCMTDGIWGARAQAGHDKELDFASLATVRRDCLLAEASGWQLNVASVASISRWRASSGTTGAWDIAFVPMLRWKRPLEMNLRVDVEFGIGPAWLSETNIGNRRKSTNFQFSDHLGLGLGDADGRWRAGLAYRHISNAGIRTPNNAVDFKGISLEWQLE
jgi:hypothetical protein